MIDYDGRTFVSISNTGNGEVSDQTVFRYRQRGEVVWATYEGGAIRFGTLIASADPDGNLDVRYGHLNADGVLMTGQCRSTPEVLADGRIRLHERWQWTGGDRSSGASVAAERR